MKTKSFTLVCILFFARFAAADFGRCQFECKITSYDMEVVRTNSIRIISEAIIFIKNETDLSLTQWYVNRYHEIKEIIKNAPIDFPTKSSSPEFCNSRIRAYILRYPFDGVINFCRSSFDDAYEAGRENYLNLLSYIMLHESMHLSGESDECAAEGWASAIYMYAKKELPPSPAWKNYYGDTGCVSTFSHREMRLAELKTYLLESKEKRKLHPWEIFKKL